VNEFDLLLLEAWILWHLDAFVAMLTTIPVTKKLKQDV